MRYAPNTPRGLCRKRAPSPLNDEMQDAMSQYAAGLKGNDVMMALRHRGTYHIRAAPVAALST